jgi:hypothetical protein
MGSKEKSLQKCVQDLIDLVLDPAGHDLTYRELCFREPQFAKISLEDFLAEYVPSRLALGCVCWVGCCANHRIENKEFRNLYFKSVMELFKTPESLGEATRFSEGLYASNADKEQSPVLGVLVYLFHKLGLKPASDSSKDEDKKVSEGFCFIMEAAEALKVAFETQFDDFFYSHKDLCTAGAKMKE